MSAPERTHECELGEDCAPYVLGAMPGEEAHAFGAHLEECAACAAEVGRLQAVADALALGVPRVRAPQSLLARIMAPVHAEAELLRAAGHEADRPARARSPWRGRLLPALAAAAALGVGLLVGALAINPGSGQRTQVIRAIVVEPGHNASAALRELGSHVELEVVGMPPPPPGRIYEIWLERGTQAPQPTDALFSVTSGGDGSADVPGDLRGVSKVLVTDEPLGGSAKPTRKPVIIAST